MTAIRPRRSLIFMPALKPEMFAKAASSGADIVCVDLEDAVAPEHKDPARPKAIDLFAGDAAAASGPECVLRINGLRTPDGLRDLIALIESPRPPRALMLPKVKAPDDVRALGELLSEGPAAEIRFHVIIETNDGLDAAYEIGQSSPRIDSLLFGAIDMAAELRVEPTWNALLGARQRLVHAAARAEVDLIDVPFLDLEDPAGLEAEARAVADLGFTGKAAIHPKQIPTLNATFTPDAERVAYARRVISAFEEGESGLVVIDGKLIEKPVLRSMYRLVAIAEASSRAE